MRHTKSFQNIKKKNKNILKKLELINSLSFRKNDYESPNSKKYNFNLSIKNENNKNFKNQTSRLPFRKDSLNKEKKNINKEKRNYNVFNNYSTAPHKENNQINIRLNIKSEIINNNFSEKKNENKKQVYEEIINKKNYLIYSLEKELSEIKEQINKIQQMKKKNNSIEEFENSNFKKRKNKDLDKIQKLKASNLISKNVRQFFKNLMLKKSESKSNSKKNSSKNILSSKNLIINTSNYNNYIKGNKNYISNNLYSESAKEIKDIEIKNLKNNSRKNSMIKSNSFLYTSNNFNSGRRSEKDKRSLSQFQTCNSNNSQNNNFNLSNCSNGNFIVYELEKLKERTKSLLSNYLKFSEEG